ncbi:MAG: 16S rRNA (uracil(1498)-N(3))-methyltransferase [Deltaproteobacteria bacterium]
MNLILLFQDDFVKDRQRVCLRGRRHEHVLDVHRASVGDRLFVGLLNDKMGTGMVTRIDKDAVEMDIVLDRDPPPPLDATLILALPRPIVLKRILLSASSMGAKQIFLIHSRRVEKSYWNSPILDEERIREQLILGLEQARDTIMPEVWFRQKFKPFVEDELPGIIKGTLPLVAHPETSEPCPRQINRPVTLAIGPEGGFIPYEIELLEDTGFISVNIGERILRVETAVPVLLSKLF